MNLIVFLILIIAMISILWAFISLKREKGKKELRRASEEIAKGRVIFHSSSVGDSSS